MDELEKARVGSALQFFPEMGHRQIGKVVRSGQQSSVSYRLLCLEERGIDPWDLFNGGEEGAVGATEFYCPACNEKAGVVIESYPHSYKCPECQVHVALHNEHTLEVLHKRVPTYNRHRGSGDPACDFCGMQFHLPEAREAHMNSRHEREIEDTIALETSILARAPTSDRVQEAKSDWARLLRLEIIPRMEDQQTSAMKIDAYRQIESMIKFIFPDATVFLFGSTTTGASEQASDIDMALRLDSDSKNISDVFVIETLWELFVRCEDLPWGGVSAGDKARGVHKQPPENFLKKVTKTRVPIIGHTPYQYVPLRDQEEEERAGAVRWHGLTREEAAVLEKNAPPGSSAAWDVHPQSKQSQFRLNLPTSAEALVYRLKHPSAAVVGVPSAFKTHWDISLKYFGVRNSALIRRYFVSSPIKLAAVTIKVWSKQSGVNDPRTGLLSSYSLMIMYIYYLLCTKQASYVDPNTIGDYTDLPALPTIDDPTGGISDEAIDKAFFYIYGFFKFYTLDFDWDKTVVSLNQDPCVQVKTKESMNWTHDKEIVVDRANSVRYFVCIEDPYEDADHSGANGSPLNLGRRISNHRAFFVRGAFRDTWLDGFVNPSAQAIGRYLVHGQRI